MNTNELLSFFNERSDILKIGVALTEVGYDKIVANFSFIVSNTKTDEKNTVEITSLDELNSAVKEYFSETPTNYKNRLVIPKNLKENNPTFVHLMLD